MGGSIVFDGVSKEFVFHVDRPRSLQELFLRFWARRGKGRKERFWALRDVTFEVGAGESLAIVGENGAGKSTVLKLVCGILKPTSGELRASGSLASLLELGAGFHPDLTGRENIFLYGSILGLSRREMRARLDDIVDFAEVDRFLDVPLRHYSSGMQLRLGFAVATALDPDVLVIDEVLAVGDEAFQKKCLHRIATFQREGRTILFVSHDLDMVKRLCHRALWLEDGYLVGDGSSQEVVDRYRERTWERETERFAEEQVVSKKSPSATPDESSAIEEQSTAAESAVRWGTGEIRISDVALHGPDSEPTYLVRTGQSLSVIIKYHVREPVLDPVFGVAIFRDDGLWCYGTNTDIEGITTGVLPASGVVTVEFPGFNLLEGSYALDIAVHHADGRAYDYRRSYLSFEVRSPIRDEGVLRPVHHWYVNGVRCQSSSDTENVVEGEGS